MEVVALSNVCVAEVLVEYSPRAGTVDVRRVSGDGCHAFCDIRVQNYGQMGCVSEFIEATFEGHEELFVLKRAPVWPITEEGEFGWELERLLVQPATMSRDDPCALLLRRSDTEWLHRVIAWAMLFSGALSCDLSFLSSMHPGCILHVSHHLELDAVFPETSLADKAVQTLRQKGLDIESWREGDENAAR